MSKKINKKFSKEDIHRIIEMAWEDRTTFESIEKQFGINQDEVIDILDIVLMINLILDADYDIIADVNEDDVVNILDVILNLVL